MMTPSHFRSITALLLFASASISQAQNSMVGDGFGGRSWYAPTNFIVGSYGAYIPCSDGPCNSNTNQLYGWGNTASTQICSTTPVAIPGITDVRYVSVGYVMGAIKYDDTGWIWGEILAPEATQVISDVKFVDAAAYHVSFVKNDGTVWSVGYNSGGPFGNGTSSMVSTLVPQQMSGVSNAVRVACGMSTNYVLLADGTVLATGYNGLTGLLGDPSLAPGDTAFTPIPIPGLSNIVDIKAHTMATIALDADGHVFCWGTLGPFSFGTLTPTQMELNDIVAISACTDGSNFLALDAFGNCYIWGVNWDLSGEPVMVATDVIDILSGETFAYIVKEDGSLWARGSSNLCSIWLDLADTYREEFTQVNAPAVGVCQMVGTTAIPATGCDGESSITVMHAGGEAPYTYDIGLGPQSSNVFSGLSAGDFTVTVTDAEGCVSTATCTINAEPDPIFQFSEVRICPDEGYLLPWGELADTTGTFWDTTVVSTGCDTIRAVSVLMDPYPFATMSDTMCTGEPYALPSGLLVDAPGLYFDTLVVPGACDTIFSVEVVWGGVAPQGVVTATNEVITVGESTTLIAAGGTSYSWYPATGLSCLDCPIVTATPLETTDYCVIVGSSATCLDDTVCVRILVEPLCTPENIFIPTAFSPNANGKNDMQCVLGATCIADMVFNIFDRWGNKVFESTDPAQCWDGLYNGSAMDPGVFAFHFTATLTDGRTVIKSGNITLVR